MKLNTKRNILDKAPRCFYLEDVNINYSFSTLEKLAKDLGAELSNGDILVVDNLSKTKRKAFKKTVNGCIILYVSLLRKNTFTPLNIETESEDTPLINFFQV